MTLSTYRLMVIQYSWAHGSVDTAAGPQWSAIVGARCPSGLGVTDYVVACKGLSTRC